MTYTNCAQAPDETTSTEQSSFADGLSFAYVEKADTIAYMSCSEVKESVNQRAYFTFRVGAYQSCQPVPGFVSSSCTPTGGLTMSDAFRKSTAYYSTQDRARLFTGAVNGDTRLNLSVRLRGNLQSMYRESSSSVSGANIDSFLPPLSGAEIAGPLAGVKTGYLMNYFPGATDKRLMEASLRFYKFENIMKTTRTNLAGGGDPAYLVMGYSESSDELEEKLRVPATVNGAPFANLSTTAQARYAYGTGFALSFALPNGYSGGEQRVLSSTVTPQEIDLATNQPRASSWDCSTGYQFVIVRPEDLSAVSCRRGPDQYRDANQQKALAYIRRVLRVEDWYVDMDNHCVVPKRTGDYCYGDPAKQGRTIQYTTAACTNAGSTLCPHFVSVCVRR